MDTRTVLSGIHFGDYTADELDQTLAAIDPERRPYAAGLLRSALDPDASLYSIEEIISWITGLKSRYELDVQRIPLNRVRRWTRGDCAISHEDGRYFSVIADPKLGRS